ncbi:MAG: ATP-binding protein, partial [Syntrophales bacterium]
VKGKFFQEAFPSEEGNNSFLLFLEKGLREREIPFQEVKISLPGKRSSTFWTRVSPSGNDMLVVLKDLKTVKNIRDQLRKAEQLAALGTLASGVAHEVRNPLGSLRGLTELISEDLSPDDPKRLYTENMLKEIDRLNHLVEDILNFAQNPMSSLEPTDISQILSHCISLARYNFPDKNITVKEIHQPGLPLIQADQERLIQVFLNIMGNAFEASPDKGRIEVESKESRERGNLIVTISDSGPGITTESLPLVFDPFYTTKEKGTGLGLSIAQNIITAYGGSMEVESVPGQGATFSVVLPISAETEAQKYKSTGK